MFFFDWFRNFLRYIGLGQKDARILFLGLDNAGKTTLLQMMKDNRVGQHVPTLHPHSEELIVGKVRLKAFDLGGHQTARRIWKDYFATVDAVVFMVDATDRERFPESKSELLHLLDTQELSSVPFVILGNKIDLPAAVSEDDLRQQLGLLSYITHRSDHKVDGRSRPVELFMCSVVKRMGYSDAFKWLAGILA